MCPLSLERQGQAETKVVALKMHVPKPAKSDPEPRKLKLRPLDPLAVGPLRVLGVRRLGLCTTQVAVGAGQLL